jgi:phage minor structural protein
MINLYNLSRKKIAVLDNAFEIDETKEINSVYSLEFSMPSTDLKNELCQKYYYVRYDEGELYRITSVTKSSSNGQQIIRYFCEHVIATLIDDVIFGSETFGNLGFYTSNAINYILSKQTTTRWTLGTCDFRRQFEYTLENENLLAGLFSIANRFDVPYMWSYDTNVFPWRVSLKAIDTTQKPLFYIRAGKNILEPSETEETAEICTKLYCLGYGDGINQLTIKSVNDGIPYLLAEQEYIDRYGLISRIFTDKRFTDAQSLKERGQALLNELKTPRMTREFDVVDLYEMTKADYDKAEVGRITLLTDDNTKTYITKITKRLDEAGDLKIELSTKTADIASSIADLADRQRINEVYSQGATQIYAQSVQANATTTKGAILSFFIPAEMKIVNAVKAKITLNRFRSYSQATAGGGESIISSSSGGSSVVASNSGGSSSPTSSSGGSSTPTSNAAGDASVTSLSATEVIYIGSVVGSDPINIPKTYISGETAYGGSSTTFSHKHSAGSLYFPSIQIGGVPSHTHQYSASGHSHTVNIPSHSHSVSIPSHTHSVSIPSHNHSVSIPSHTHTVNIPNHTHGIVQGIYEFGSPTKADLYVNGVKKATIPASSSEIDITQYLLNAQGYVPRGSWINLEVRPNDLSYVIINLFIQGFIQSAGGGTY